MFHFISLPSGVNIKKFDGAFEWIFQKARRIGRKSNLIWDNLPEAVAIFGKFDNLKVKLVSSISALNLLSLLLNY